MNRGRAHRPVSSEEMQCWAQAAERLGVLSSLCPNSLTVDAIGRVNRGIALWPTDENLAMERYDEIKTMCRKLMVGLKDIQTNAKREVEAIDMALESVGLLVALRAASDEAPLGKRKRPREPSPASSVLSAAKGVASHRGTPLTSVPSRGSLPPGLTKFSKDPKARREVLAAQLPLQSGRKVAFHPPVKKDPDFPIPPELVDENEWILAVVTKCIKEDKNRYEVQDAETGDDGAPGLLYNTTLRQIIPLPDPNALPNSASHLNAYQEFPTGSTVMALYPDTSCFYRAEVIASPKDQPTPKKESNIKHVPTYKLRFEDDDDQVHSVSAHWVVEWPGAPIP